jgi:hypothetical protein
VSVTRCSICDEPAHASETDDLDRHPACDAARVTAVTLNETMRPTVAVPELEIDAEMLRRHQHHVSANGRLERRIVAALVAHMTQHGWRPSTVYDGEETTEVTDAKSVMEVIFNLDESSLRFRKGRSEHGVLLIGGNGIDMISDWNFHLGDADRFNAAMEAFDAEVYA